MEKEMPEELSKTYREVWYYLEAGEWLNASIAASHLAGLDPAGNENRELAGHVRKLSEVAERVRNGSKRGALARLEEVSGSLPRLSEMASFRSLVASARYTSGKKGVLVSIITAIVFITVCNFAGYKYVQAQPINTDTQIMVNRAWLGLKKIPEPADFLLLGDSSCLNNLAPGAVSDRLGGYVINLGNNAGTSLLMDAWMLSAYISEHGPPRSVVVTRILSGYGAVHSTEFMANVPLPWGYWDTYNLAPEWKEGEIADLLIAKYGVLYSNADVLRERLLEPANLFNSDANKYPASIYNHSYIAGNKEQKQDMDINTRTPGSYFKNFYPSADATKAIKHMADLAREHRFQLYFTLQVEWDEAVKAGLRTEQIAAQKKYLSRFTDDAYVHVVEQVPGTLFTREQMQNPNHLWHGSEKIYTEGIVNGIVAIQNGLTAPDLKNLGLTSVSLDADSYQPGATPVVTVGVTNTDGAAVSGSVSCLLKPSGGPDGYWTARAPAKSVNLEGNATGEVTLNLTAGKLDQPGLYDLVIFLRQDAGNLSHETRIELAGKVTVK
ncbi:MAG: hypothetical protein A2Z29_04450 [Chloroflexi bacterium RBG_16_56_11]|nr:MAG: hypothetical protein A2Z29_04450 [Chloroflexi bacterium RBG_16_56_11]